MFWYSFDYEAKRSPFSVDAISNMFTSKVWG